MTNVMRKAYTEVDAILKYLPIEYVNKVPQKFRRMFNDCKLDNYIVKIDPNKSINEQKVIYETLVILTILKYNYWCESDLERKKIEQTLKDNDVKAKDMYDISKLNIKKELNEDLVNMENVISSNVAKNNTFNNLPMKVENKSWFSKFILKIKSLFKR